MANYTKKAILQTFETMLTKQPFEKITVSALVAACGISSNTFYYHFRDIYDLLDAWLRAKEAEILASLPKDAPWDAVLRTALHLMQDNVPLVYHVINSISRERLERYVFTSVEESFVRLVRLRTAGLDIPEDKLDMIGSFFCSALLGFLLKFIWNQMRDDVDEAADRLAVLFRGTSEYFIQQALSGEL